MNSTACSVFLDFYFSLLVIDFNIFHLCVPFHRGFVKRFTFGHVVYCVCSETLKKINGIDKLLDVVFLHLFPGSQKDTSISNRNKEHNISGGPRSCRHYDM